MIKTNRSPIIQTGFITNRLDAQLYPYTMKLLNSDDILQVIELHNKVIDALPDPDLCWRFPVSYIERYLGDQGITVGVFVEKQLIGFRVLYFPGNQAENPGLDMGLDDSELDQVAHLPLSNVHPDFTGNSLQKNMTLQVINIAKETRPFRYLCSIVSPKNYASMTEKFEVGMVVGQLTIKYGTFLRYIFYEDMVKPLEVAKENAIFIPSIDTERQMELLKQGYYGFQLSEEQGKKGILFGKKMSGC